MTEKRFAFGYIMHFRDGGEPEEQLLGIDTEEKIHSLRLQIPAVAYSGSRPIDRAEWVVVEISPEAEAAWRGRDGSGEVRLLRRFLCWLGWHAPDPATDTRFSIYWYCPSCGQVLRGKFWSRR